MSLVPAPRNCDSKFCWLSEGQHGILVLYNGSPTSTLAATAFSDYVTSGGQRGPGLGTRRGGRSGVNHRARPRADSDDDDDDGNPRPARRARGSARAPTRGRAGARSAPHKPLRHGLKPATMHLITCLGFKAVARRACAFCLSCTSNWTEVFISLCINTFAAPDGLL